jgi:Aminopeptidase N
MKLILLFAVLLAPLSMYSQPVQPPIEPGVSHELAKWRAAHYSDVRYKLNLTLEKMSPVLKGTIEIRVKLSEATGSNVPIILDWRKIKGHEDKSTISNVTLNGTALGKIDAFSRSSGGTPKGVTLTSEDHNEHLVFRDGVVAGENVIKLDFTSPILTSGSAITRYVDKEDGAEYIYSLFVPSDASTAFPVFDQPDLKARFTLNISAPQDWLVISNGEELQTSISSTPDRNLPLHRPNYDLSLGLSKTTLDAKVSDTPTSAANLHSSYFNETKPISTYVFAFAAGPFERVSVPPALAGGEVPDADPASLKSETPPPADAGGTDLGKRVSSSPHVSKGSAARVDPSLTVGVQTPSTNIYVRRSQAAKFKPHAAEVFRLNREAIKYFEEYFDYKFPFPKYDLVLIPEFPFGGMEHAGATFLRESAIIFPQEPTKNDHISRAVLIFHEAAHQWFGDTVTMRWFDDLWLKEGFANFAAYKAMEKIMPEANAWKVFYERVKEGAYQTDSTKGTTPIYQEIKNLSAAKSAYGNIVYNKAPAFLRQAEFYLGEDKFQTAVRAFLKQHEFKNAGWEDLVKEFEVAGKQDLKEWANVWVKQPGLPIFRTKVIGKMTVIEQQGNWEERFRLLAVVDGNRTEIAEVDFAYDRSHPRIDLRWLVNRDIDVGKVTRQAVLPNYQDYGYGIFLLDDKSRDYVLKNIQNEKDPFLRAMMWGSLWDSVREGELDPREYVELVVRVLSASSGKSTTPSAEAAATPPIQEGSLIAEDESTVATLLGRTSTALNYYLPSSSSIGTSPPANAGGTDLRGRVENMLIERMRNAETAGQRITYYRAFLNIASSETALRELRKLLFVQSTVRPPDSGIHRSGIEMIISPSERIPRKLKFGTPEAPFELKTKDKFDIITRLISSGYVHGIHLLNELEKIETSDEAKRYAYAARAAISTKENKAKYWNDFVNNKEISESWIEAAFGPWNSIRHSELTLPYLQKALQELPNHKRSRKIFFVNGWLGAFIGGQQSEEALAIVNKFLADNPNLDKDLRLKILENVDLIERAVKIRAKYGKGT